MLERQEEKRTLGTQRSKSLANSAIKTLTQSKRYANLLIPSLNMEILSLLNNHEKSEAPGQNAQEEQKNKEEADVYMKQNRANEERTQRETEEGEGEENFSDFHQNRKVSYHIDEKAAIRGEENIRNNLNKAILYDLVTSKLKESFPEAPETLTSLYEHRGNETLSPKSRRIQNEKMMKEAKEKRREEHERLHYTAKQITNETVAGFKIFQNIMTNFPGLVNPESVVKKLKNDVKPIKSLFSSYRTTEEFPMLRITSSLVSQELHTQSSYEETEKGLSKRLTHLHYATNSVKEKIEKMKKHQSFFEQTLEKLQDGENGLNEAKHALVGGAKFDRRGAVRDVQNIKTYMRLNGLESKKAAIKKKFEEEISKIKTEIEEGTMEIAKIQKELAELRNSKLLFKTKLKQIYGQLLNVDRSHPELIKNSIPDLKHPKEVILALWDLKEELIYDSFPKFLDQGNVDFLFKMARLEKEIKKPTKPLVTTQGTLPSLSKIDKNERGTSIPGQELTGDNIQKRKEGMAAAASRMAQLKHEMIHSFRLVNAKNPKTGLSSLKWEQVSGASIEKTPSQSHRFREQSMASIGSFRFKTKGSSVLGQSENQNEFMEEEKSFIEERIDSPIGQPLDMKGVFKITEQMEKLTKAEVNRVVKKLYSKQNETKSLQEIQRVLLYILPQADAMKKIETLAKGVF